MTYGDVPSDQPSPRYRPFPGFEQFGFPVPRLDMLTGRPVHAPECEGDEEHLAECVCGLDEVYLIETRLEMGR